MFYQYYKSPLFSTIAHDKHLQIAFHCSRIITAVLVFFPLSLSLFPSPSPATVIGTSNHFLASQNQWLGEKNFAALRSIQRSKLPICFIILYDYQCICMCMNLCSRIYTYLYYKLLQYIIIFAPTLQIQQHLHRHNQRHRASGGLVHGPTRSTCPMPSRIEIMDVWVSEPNILDGEESGRITCLISN